MYTEKFIAGSVNNSINVFLQNSSATIGLTNLTHLGNSYPLKITYCPALGLPYAIIPQPLSTPQSPWVSGGFKEIEKTLMPGFYRFDVPDAVFAFPAGTKIYFQFHGCAGMKQLDFEIELV